MNISFAPPAGSVYAPGPQGQSRCESNVIHNYLLYTLLCGLSTSLFIITIASFRYHNRLFHVKYFLLHIRVQWYRMGTMVQMYKVMFHVKHRVLKFYSVGCAFIAIPDVSAVVLLVSGFVAAAFSGSFLDWQSFL